MNRSKKQQPQLKSNADTLFKLPVPIPEPPRMVNVKPSVPDLSINCEDEKEEAGHLALNFDYSARSMESECEKNAEILKEIERINQRLQLNGLRDDPNIKDSDGPKRTLTNGKSNGKSSGRKSLSPKDISASRYSESPSSSGKVSTKDLANHDSHESLKAIIKRHDEKLDRIAEQVQLILSLSLKKQPEKRSVSTMTNLSSRSRSDRSTTPRRACERSKTKKKMTDSGLLTSESESRSDGSELRSRSKVREEFYEKMLRNVNQKPVVSYTLSDQSDSFSSVSPPRINRSLPTTSRGPTNEIDMISKLAEKYLSNGKSDPKSSSNRRSALTKKTSLSEGEEQKLRRNKRSTRPPPPTTVSDFTEEASIGVTNYLRKYGLCDD